MIEYIGVKSNGELPKETRTLSGSPEGGGTLSLLSGSERENEIQDAYHIDDDIIVYKKDKFDMEFIEKVSKEDDKVVSGIELLKWCAINNKSELLLKLLKFRLHKESELKEVLKEINEYRVFVSIIEITKYKLIFPEDNEILIKYIRRNNESSNAIVSMILTGDKVPPPSGRPSSYTATDILLRETCKTGNIQIFKLITNKYKSRIVLTPDMLNNSIINDRIEMIKVLLNMNVNYHDNDYNCLILASEYGVIDILIYLLEFISLKNAKNVKIKDIIKKSLNIGFSKALLNNRIEVVKFMLSGEHMYNRTMSELPLATKREDNVYIYNDFMITVNDSTTNWLSKKGNKEMIYFLIKYKKLSNYQIIKMIKCNEEIMKDVFKNLKL
jgi:hypothetical protein